MLVGGAVTERITINVMLMGVVLVNGVVYVFAAWRLRDPPELYESGDGGDAPVDAARLWSDLRSVVRMRAFWALFFHGVLFMSPMGHLLTELLFFVVHAHRS